VWPLSSLNKSGQSPNNPLPLKLTILSSLHLVVSYLKNLISNTACRTDWHSSARPFLPFTQRNIIPSSLDILHTLNLPMLSPPTSAASSLQTTNAMARKLGSAKALRATKAHPTKNHAKPRKLRSPKALNTENANAAPRQE